MCKGSKTIEIRLMSGPRAYRSQIERAEPQSRSDIPEVAAESCSKKCA